MINSIENLNKLFNFHNEAIFTSAHMYLWSKDKNGKYLSCNKPMYQDLGLHNEFDIIGLTDLDLCWKKLRIVYRKHDNIVIHQREAKIFPELCKTFDGRKINFYSYKTPLLGNSKKVLGTMGFAFPISNKLADCMESKMHTDIFKCLSLREKQCLIHYFNGKTAKETAIALNLSYRTIEEYFTNIKKKLNCRYKRDLLSLGDRP